MIVHNRPTLGQDEIAAAQRVLASAWVAQGAEVEAFENELCSFIGLPISHAVAVASGSSALYLALWALKAQKQVVASPVYGSCTVNNAIVLAGACPHFLDISTNGPNVDPRTLSKCGASIAIVPHMFGLPVDLRNIKGMHLIEDCAQALGARIDGVSVGLQADMGIFSFQATKLITSGGQGGMVVSRDKDLIDAIRDYRDYDGHDDRKPRFNFQMTDLQAAVGRVQLRRLPEFLRRRTALFELYRSANLCLLDVPAPASPVRYRAVIQTDQATALLVRLNASCIKAIVPVEDWELLGLPSQYPNATSLTRHTISLPLHPSMLDAEARHIISVLESV
jgi:perosamine synthetase